METGTNFIKDGKTYRLADKRLQSEMAYKSHMNYSGRPAVFKLVNEYGEIPAEDLYIPHYREHCRTCGGRLTCNGCGDCGKCREPVMTRKEMDEYDAQYHTFPGYTNNGIFTGTDFPAYNDFSSASIV